MPEADYPRQVSQPYGSSYHQQYQCKQEFELPYSNMPHHEALFLQLPQLESPNSVVPYVYERNSNNAGSNFQTSNLMEDQEHMQQMQHQNMNASVHGNSREQAQDQVTDWRVLDKFVASQLSHDNAGNPKDITYSSPTTYHVGNQMNSVDSKKLGVPQDFIVVPNSTCQIELWK